MDTIITGRDSRADINAALPISAVAWAAIIAGALAAAAATLVLTTLGMGLGLTTISPWSGAGVSVTTFGTMAIAWMILAQLLSAALGGYLAGRLRMRWSSLSSDEVFFRDTAHGFMAWALATVVTALLLTSAAMSTASQTARAASTVAAGAAQGAAQAAVDKPGSVGGMIGYHVDTMFRSEALVDPAMDQSLRDQSQRDQNLRGEASRMLMEGLKDGDLSAPDRTYLARMVATRTGIDEAQAQKRIDEVIAEMRAAADRVRAAADSARKASAAIAILIALSMVIGAFVSSAAAAFGGRLRDEP